MSKQLNAALSGKTVSKKHTSLLNSFVRLRNCYGCQAKAEQVFFVTDERDNLVFMLTASGCLHTVERSKVMRASKKFITAFVLRSQRLLTIAKRIGGVDTKSLKQEYNREYQYDVLL